MLVLFETPAGYALFKCKEGGELTSNPETIGKHFESAAKAQKLCVRAHACRSFRFFFGWEDFGCHSF